MTEDDDSLSPEQLSALRGPKSPPASLEEATIARLRAMGVLRKPGLVVRPLPGFLALCGSFLLGLAVWPLLPVLHAGKNSRPQFLLLLYGDPQHRGQEHRPEYVAWARGLAARGQLTGDGELTGEVEDLSKSVPVEGTEQPLGFFVLRASDRAEALKLSMGCPHLRYGGRVELRPFVARPGPS
jgi:YCII-related domain-containing protein